MILTVTMNPSIDISYPLETLHLDTVNRVDKVSKTAGGKGLNVTRVLAEIGDPVSATGLIGGSTGQFILDHLDQEIGKEFFEIQGETRNCIAILHEGQQTEILEKGPSVSEEEGQAFLDHYEALLPDVAVVAISGSLPAGLPLDYYSQLVERAKKAGKPVVLDCSGASLEKALAAPIKPTVIKPNNEELSQLLGYEVTKDLDQLKEVLQSNLFKGIDWVIVSLGADGAFAKHGDVFYKVDIPKIEVVNPVGSGDSTVAGIVSALYHQEDDQALLTKANVLGMLNAQEATTGHINIHRYDDLYQQINVKEV